MRWIRHILNKPREVMPAGNPHLLGVVPGEGIGPEVVGAALDVLEAVEAASGLRFERRTGGAIGREAEQHSGRPLTQEVIRFFQGVFAGGGAVLCGPGGGRFVYDLRKEFDLFCKVSTVQPWAELERAGRMKPEHTRGVDALIVRENTLGIYQGEWGEHDSEQAGRAATHSFHYTEKSVARILKAAAAMAGDRRGRLAVVVKNDGVPTVSSLWRDCGTQAAHQAGIELEVLDVDYAAYRLLQDARQIDVLVAPNLFGDVLTDIAGVLVGSRGLCFSGNFSSSGAAVFQTNHGAAYDLKGSDRANPAGQILSLAMLLEESFGLAREARWIETALREVWRCGWRTEDLTEPGCRIAGTAAMASLIAEAVARAAAAER